jgi:hypothetical protein
MDEWNLRGLKTGPTIQAPGVYTTMAGHLKRKGTVSESATSSLFQ